ncbi:MAG: hypothetical protein AVDCRST_MAG69-2810, partial [uncultured Solirubrobacteraceae bacterium]
ARPGDRPDVPAHRDPRRAARPLPGLAVRHGARSRGADRRRRQPQPRPGRRAGAGGRRARPARAAQAGERGLRQDGQRRSSHRSRGGPRRPPGQPGPSVPGARLARAHACARRRAGAPGRGGRRQAALSHRPHPARRHLLLAAVPLVRPPLPLRPVRPARSQRAGRLPGHGGAAAHPARDAGGSRALRRVLRHGLRGRRLRPADLRRRPDLRLRARRLGRPPRDRHPRRRRRARVDLVEGVLRPSRGQERRSRPLAVLPPADM